MYLCMLEALSSFAFVILSAAKNLSCCSERFLAALRMTMGGSFVSHWLAHFDYIERFSIACFVLDALVGTCYSAMHNAGFIRGLLPGVALRRVRSHYDASQDGCYSVELA